MARRADRVTSSSITRPLTDESLGLRKSSLLEGVRLAQDLLRNDIQSVVFARSRRSVEIILRYLQENQSPREASNSQFQRGLDTPLKEHSGYLTTNQTPIL